ncbi:MAG: hypothetical protein J5725_00830 [Bacteroidales bacterium]|nr:hypothetical protein [Bacteroidales bacterium]
MKVEVKKFKINKGNVKKLLQSEEVMEALKDNAKTIGTTKTSFVGFDRCHVIVKDENDAYRDNDS